MLPSPTKVLSTRNLCYPETEENQHADQCVQGPLLPSRGTILSNARVDGSPGTIQGKESTQALSQGLERELFVDLPTDPMASPSVETLEPDWQQEYHNSLHT